jgi:hypothetical protein
VEVRSLWAADGGTPVAIMAAAQHGWIIMTFRITRRHMLASAAASAAAFGTGLDRIASAQSVKRIEQFAPGLDMIIGTGEPINQLADGVGGDAGRPKVRCGGRRAATSCSATSMATDA